MKTDSPEARMWLAVVENTISEFRSPPANTGPASAFRVKTMNEAKSEWFAEICSYINLDASWVIRVMERINDALPGGDRISMRGRE